MSVSYKRCQQHEDCLADSRLAIACLRSRTCSVCGDQLDDADRSFKQKVCESKGVPYDHPKTCVFCLYYYDISIEEHA